jgi:uncharacterized membrane protein
MVEKVYFVLASWTPLGILMDAMITKHIVEATTEALALVLTIGAVGMLIAFDIQKAQRASRIKAKRSKG